MSIVDVHARESGLDARGMHQATDKTCLYIITKTLRIMGNLEARLLTHI